jgi:hypothetical protein
MTEAEWLTCTDWVGWEAMWKHVPKHRPRARALFGVACCRAVWHLLTDERSRKAVEVAERYADGQASRDEWDQACRGARVARQATRIPEEAEATASQHEFDVAAAHAAVSYLTERGTDGREFICADLVGEFAPLPSSDGQRHEYPSPRECEGICNLLREIFGNPFRPVDVDPAWLVWNDGCVPKLAQSIYDAGRFEDLPILADALLDAGCTDPELLGHLRSPGPHARGCWAVDLLTGRE